MVRDARRATAGLYLPLQIAGSLGVAFALLALLVIATAPLLQMDGVMRGLDEENTLLTVAFLGGVQLLCVGAVLLPQLRPAARCRDALRQHAAPMTRPTRR